MQVIGTIGENKKNRTKPYVLLRVVITDVNPDAKTLARKTAVVSFANCYTTALAAKTLAKVTPHGHASHHHQRTQSSRGETSHALCTNNKAKATTPTAKLVNASVCVWACKRAVACHDGLHKERCPRIMTSGAAGTASDAGARLVVQGKSPDCE